MMSPVSSPQRSSPSFVVRPSTAGSGLPTVKGLKSSPRVHISNNHSRPGSAINSGMQSPVQIWTASTSSSPNISPDPSPRRPGTSPALSHEQNSQSFFEEQAAMVSEIGRLRADNIALVNALQGRMRGSPGKIVGGAQFRGGKAAAADPELAQLKLVVRNLKHSLNEAKRLLEDESEAHQRTAAHHTHLLFQIEEHRKENSSLTSQIALLKGQLSENSTTINGLMEKMQSLQAERDKAVAAREKADEVVKSVTESLHSARNEAIRYKAESEKYKQHSIQQNTQILELKAKIEELEIQIRSLSGNANSSMAELLKYQNLLKEAQEALKHERSKVDKLENDLKHRGMDLLSVKSKLRSLTTEYEETRARLNARISELENLLKHSQYGGASEEELEEMKMKMRSALSKLSAKEDELKKALDALNATKTRLNDALDQRDDLKVQLNDANAQIKQLELRVNVLEQKNAEIPALKVKNDTLETKNASQKKTIESLEQQLADAKAAGSRLVDQNMELERRLALQKQMMEASESVKIAVFAPRVQLNFGDTSVSSSANIPSERIRHVLQNDVLPTFVRVFSQDTQLSETDADAKDMLNGKRTVELDRWMRSQLLNMQNAIEERLEKVLMS